MNRIVISTEPDHRVKQQSGEQQIAERLSLTGWKSSWNFPPYKPRMVEVSTRVVGVQPPANTASDMKTFVRDNRKTVFNLCRSGGFVL